MVHTVDGIHDIVIRFSEYFFSSFRCEKCVEDAYGRLGIYEPTAFGHRFNLWLSDLPIQSVNLAVYVTLTNVVEINERD